MRKNNARLEDLLPSKPIATLDGKEFSFRAPSLGDDGWIKENIGDQDALRKMVKETQWDKISKLAYHLIDDAGRAHFRARSATIISETTGESVQRHMTGPEVLLQKITGVENGVALLGAITRAMANANPLIGDLVKKSLAEAEKIISGQTGEKSSTRSQVNTNGRKRK